MRVAGNRTFWISLAVGSAAALALYQWRRRAARSGRWCNGKLPRDRSRCVSWRFDHRFGALASGKTLRIELSSPAVVHWSVNQWDLAHDTPAVQVAPSLYAAELATENLAPGARLQFTFFWPEVNRWEGEDFEVRIEADNYILGGAHAGAP